MLRKLTKEKRETTLKKANLKQGATSKHEAKNVTQGKVVEVQQEKQSLLNLWMTFNFTSVQTVGYFDGPEG